MPNRRRRRRVSMLPPMEGFKPYGGSNTEEETIELLYEEYEAIRLADYEDLTQEEAAIKMDISRPTFTRLYEKARKKIAKAFVESKSIVIKGGTYFTENYWYRCRSCSETMATLKPSTLCRRCDSDELTQLSISAPLFSQNKSNPSCHAETSKS